MEKIYNCTSKEFQQLFNTFWNLSENLEFDKNLFMDNCDKFIYSNITCRFKYNTKFQIGFNNFGNKITISFCTKYRDEYSASFNMLDQSLIFEKEIGNRTYSIKKETFYKAMEDFNYIICQLSNAVNKAIKETQDKQENRIAE